MEFNTNKILITGANGWLGKNLIFSLLNGIEDSTDIDKPNEKIEIKCLVLKGDDTSFIEKQSKSLSIIQGNITNKKDCEQFTENSKGAILFHCAGIIHPNKTKQFYEVNVDGTKNILDAAVKNGLKKIVIVSSNSPCGVNPTNNDWFNESCDYNPYMEYGRSKMIMEKIVNDYYHDGKIETVIIRPPWFYGPHQPPRQIRFYKMIMNGKVPIVGNGENKRGNKGAVICDCLAVAIALTHKTSDDIVSAIRWAHIEVECTKGAITRGQTVCDFGHCYDGITRKRNLRWVTAVKNHIYVDKFTQLFQ